MNYIAFDLDRVLFDTDRFTQDIVSVSAGLCHVSKEKFEKDISLFRVMGNYGLHHYDYAAQLASYDSKIEDVLPVVKQKIGKLAKSYVYPDVVKVLEQCSINNDTVFVLTYGDSLYQQLKIDIASELQGLDSHIILTPKGTFIEQTFPLTNGVLFDDTPQEWLPSGWEHMLVDRKLHPDDALALAVMDYQQK